MSFDTLFKVFLSPSILFFVLGIVIGALRSNLEIPKALVRFFSIYLLLSLGFVGGVALNQFGLPLQGVWVLIVAVVFSSLIPLYLFPVLRRRVNPYDAGAIAAAYGSVSAVTFIAATGLLEALGVPYGGHLIAAMVVMESPAIIVSILLVRLIARDQPIRWGETLREAFFNGSILLLLGSLIVGLIVGEKGGQKLAPFTTGIFRGILALFLLDLGMIVARHFRDLKQTGFFLAAVSLVVPVINGIAALVVAYLLKLPQGDAFLLTVLAGSASFVIVPAAMRLAVPEANPGYYTSMALVVTFTFNILIGLPAYYWLVELIWANSG